MLFFLIFTWKICTVFFKCFAFSKFNLPSHKSDNIFLDQKLKQYLWQENSSNQEKEIANNMLDKNDQNIIMKICWLHMFLLFGLCFKFYSSSVWNIYYSTKRLYIHYNVLLQRRFYSRLLHFYIHYCLPRMNTF